MKYDFDTIIRASRDEFPTNGILPRRKCIAYVGGGYGISVQHQLLLKPCKSG